MKVANYNDVVKVLRPERVVLVTSFDFKNNRSNIIALGWKMRTSFSPPMVAVSVGKTKYSHGLIEETGEFVLAFPGEDMAEQVIFCGTNSGRDVDKFEKTGLTQVNGKHVKPSLIGECVANFECKLAGSLETGDHTIFAGEVLASWTGEKKKLLVSVGNEEGYKVLVEGKGHRLGVIKD